MKNGSVYKQHISSTSAKLYMTQQDLDFLQVLGAAEHFLKCTKVSTYFQIKC